MTRERIVGFLLGISVGAVMGYYLRPDSGHPQNPAQRSATETKPASGAGQHRAEDRLPGGGGVAWIGSAS